ncbi:MAG: LysR family transcriptional regulator [Rickettsiales bacterium]|nr:LysR family transcriptional regulator [Rickettsiales bacterium]|tara:strand:+ start:693 stop:1589 length:897 start_codon:yes stop_codon:yes gene_type:complete
MNFTLDQLSALDAIVRTGSFAAAARELHKVPSAISYLVRELESSLGIELFDRSGRSAVLTPAGQRLLEGSRQVIEQARQLSRTAAELRDGWEPELFVVVDGALPMSAITSCLRRFADPQIPTRLRIDVEYQEGVIDRFENQPADLAMVLGLAGDADQEGLECRALGALELLLVASPQHPLAAQIVTEGSRADHAELVVRDSSPRFARDSKRSFMGSRNVVYLSDFHSKRIALLEAAGYGWIPRHFIAADLSQGRLQVLKAEPCTWTYEPQLISRQGQSLGRGGRLFVKTLLPVLEKKL